jgi:hypothetical protein
MREQDHRLLRDVGASCAAALEQQGLSATTAALDVLVGHSYAVWMAASLPTQAARLATGMLLAKVLERDEVETRMSMDPMEQATAFRHSLAETIAWCTARATLADPERCLRTPALDPGQLDASVLLGLAYVALRRLTLTLWALAKTWFAITGCIRPFATSSASTSHSCCTLLQFLFITRLAKGSYLSQYDESCGVRHAVRRRLSATGRLRVRNASVLLGSTRRIVHCSARLRLQRRDFRQWE